MQIFGRVADQQRTPLVVGCPGERKVHGGFIEDHQITDFTRDIVNNILVDFPAPKVKIRGEIGFVAARNNAQTAIAFIHIRELELEYHHAATHFAVAIGVVL